MDVGKRPSSTDASPARAEAPLALARDATDASPERAEAPLALVRPARDASLGDLSAVEKKRIGRLVKVLVAVESGYARARETWRKEEDGLRAGAAAQAAALAASDPLVVYAKPLVADGAAVVGANDALPDWILDVMTTHDDPKAALDHVLGLATTLDMAKLVIH